MKKLNELTVLEAIKGLKKGAFSAVELMQACLDRTKEMDPKINAFITVVGDQALEKAKEADEIIAVKGKKAWEDLPLLGIPYTVKDSYSTKGIETTAGSNILKGYIPPYESTVTKRLNKSGAILFAKDNQDAFGHGGSTESSDFFTTKNPWDLTRLPGGSAGGTAAAVAANMTIFGMGGDTGGSIRMPSSWCGVTGLKPTYGCISRYGYIAMASSTDTPGPITKTSEDAAYVLKIVAGKDMYDATTSHTIPKDYMKIINEFDFKDKVVGKPKSYFDKEIDRDIIDAVEDALELMKSKGAKIVDLDLLSPNYSLAVYTIVQRAEVSSNLARFDGIRFGHTRDAFGFEARKRMMLGSYVLSVGYYDAFYAKAQRVRTVVSNQFKEAFRKVDFIVGPTTPKVAMKVGAINSSPMFGELVDRLQDPASMSGLPAIAIPCGISEGLPIGMQIIGNMFEEDKILGAAHAFQKSTKFHEEIYKIK